MRTRKAFLLNGSSVAGDPPDRISEALEHALLGEGLAVKRMDVHSARIRPCLACGACAFRRPGECVVVDDGRDIPRLWAQADIFAFVSGIRFGGYPAAAKRALERTLPVVHPCFTRYRGEMHHRLRYPRRPFMLFVGWQPNADPETRSLYHRLTERNATNYQTSHRALVMEDELDQETLEQEMSELVHALEGQA
ncbi:MAG: NAD(P)H-dependent oxidoreductase [Candidatus Bipolaricaulota bacterium]